MLFVWEIWIMNDTCALFNPWKLKDFKTGHTIGIKVCPFTKKKKKKSIRTYIYMKTWEAFFWCIIIKVGTTFGYFSAVVACHYFAPTLLAPCRRRGFQPANQIICLEWGRRRRPLCDLGACVLCVATEPLLVTVLNVCSFVTLNINCALNPFSVKVL